MTDVDDVDSAILATIKDLGLTVRYVFVPRSMSEDREESIHWRVGIGNTTNQTGITMDYAEGTWGLPDELGSCARTVEVDKAIKEIVEKGTCSNPRRFEDKNNLRLEFGRWVAAPWAPRGTKPRPGTLRLEFPKPVDVVWSLVQNMDVLDYRTFEHWASAFGFDSDSRRAERIYKQQVDLATTFLELIGTDGLGELREVYEDY